jgi:hypothetical protein
MNIKQTLILAGGLAVLALFAYVALSGYGIQSSEVVAVSIAGAAIAGATGGLVYAFRDQ